MTTAAAVDARSISGSDKAPTYAVSGIARSGATRSGYTSGAAFINIGGIGTGAGASMRVLVASLSIHDSLNEQPNTCTFTVQGARPADGAEIVISLGSAGGGGRIFAGNVIRLTEVYAAQNPRNILWQVEGIDYTWHLNSKRVNRRYLTTPAAAILADLMTSYAPAGFTAVASGTLPDVDEISFTDVPLMDAIAQLAVRVGGYAVCDYTKVVRLFVDDPAAPPRPLTPDHPSLEDVRVARDLSQIVTRAIVVGGGVNALAETAIGADRIPVEDVAWYPVDGGRFVSGPQRGTYSGVVPGGPGAMVGTGAVLTPTTAPVVNAVAGTALPAGTYRYAYTWQTATGETLPSPVATATPPQITDPTVAPRDGAQNDSDDGFLMPGTVYRFKYAYATSTDLPPSQVTKCSPSHGRVSTSMGAAAVEAQLPAAYDASIKYLVIYRTKLNGSTYYLDARISLTSWSGGAWLRHLSTQGDSTLGAVEPSSNTSRSGKAFALSSVATGPTGTTARRIYRSAVNQSQLKLQSTLANNSATSTPVDAVADAALGANAPTSNTSGLVITGGVVLAGSTAVPVSSIGPFDPAGWAIVGAGQIIRYTGVSATELTGVPESGPGSLEASVAHGELITVAPQLTGVAGIVLTIQQGDPVNLMVQVDDVDAQAWLAAARGGDGIAEGVLTDNRISAAEATARAESLLQQNAKPLESLRYRCRDMATRSGATVAVNLPPPFNVVNQTFRIQDVTISGFLGTGFPPRYDASASSQRFSFEDLLRRQRVKAQP